MLDDMRRNIKQTKGIKSVSRIGGQFQIERLMKASMIGRNSSKDEGSIKSKPYG